MCDDLGPHEAGVADRIDAPRLPAGEAPRHVGREVDREVLDEGEAGRRRRLGPRRNPGRVRYPRGTLMRTRSRGSGMGSHGADVPGVTVNMIWF